MFKPPKMPDLPTFDSTPVTPPTQASAATSAPSLMNSIRKPKGGQTLLTGGQGVTAPANTSSKTLLGA